MIRKLVYLSLFVVIVVTACTPYHSSKENRELLQGKWILSRLDSTDPDSIGVLAIQDTVYLEFKNDVIVETINTNFVQEYSFSIDKYLISWYIAGDLMIKSDLVTLSEDSFVIKSRDYYWTYKKEQ